MKGAVKIAYWDTAQGNPPRLVGQIRGTPTIKFIYPSKKNKRTTNKKKIVSDYNGERKADGMYEFAASRMPNGVQRINSAKDFAKFAAKADKYALPKLVLITREGRTTVEAKSLSTEIRRRALVGEIRASKPNKDMIAKFGLDDWLTDRSGPKTVVVALKGDGTDGGVIPMKKRGKYPKFKLSVIQKFAERIALKKPYFEDEAAQAIIKARKDAAEGAKASDAGQPAKEEAKKAEKKGKEEKKDAPKSEL